MKDRSIQNINTPAKSYLCGGNHHNLLKIIKCHFVTRLGPMTSRLKGKFLFPVKPETVETRVNREQRLQLTQDDTTTKRQFLKFFHFIFHDLMNLFLKECRRIINKKTIKIEIMGFIQCCLMH